MTEFRREAPIVAPPPGWEEPIGISPRNPQEQDYFNKWGVNPSLTITALAERAITFIARREENNWQDRAETKAIRHAS